MKNFVFAVIFLLIACPVSRGISQNYYPLVATNKSWSISWFYAAPPAHMKYIKFDRDTLIGANTYKTVLETADSVASPWLKTGYIRETAGHRVYYSTNPAVSEQLLYNFSLGLNDTVYLRGMPTPFKVDTINQAQMEDGTMRQRFVLSNSQCAGSDVWIQGVGSRFGVLNSGGNCFVGETDNLICMKQNGVVLYHNHLYPTCDVISSISSPAAEPAVTVFPNPFRSQLLVTLNTGNQAHYSITDINGKICASGVISGGGNLLSTDGLKNGIYLMRISQGGGAATSVIMIKSE